MTINWFVLLTPIVLFVVILPFLFVGCARFTSSSGIGTTTSGPFGTLSTTFTLEMDPGLQAQLASPVVKIEVGWLVERTSGTLGAIKVPPTPVVLTTRQSPPPNPPALNPTNDPGATGSITTTAIGNRNRVRCNCTVTLANGSTPVVQAGLNNPAEITSNATHEFRIAFRRSDGVFIVRHERG